MNVLVIGIGWEQEPLIKRLFDIPNIIMYGVHYDENYNKEFAYKDVIVCDLRDKSSILQFSKKFIPDVVLSDQDDFAHFSQAYIAEYFQIPGPSIRDAQISSNKYLQRIQCRKSNILHPDFTIISELSALEDFAIITGFPIIIKPISNRGSYGVVKINSMNDLPSAFLSALEHSHSGLLIAEQYIHGVELTVDGYCFDKDIKTLGIASKGKIIDDLQVSFDIQYPAEINEDIADKIKSINESVIKKLGYTFGMCHAEYILDEEGKLYLVEAANRGGGCFTSEIIAPNHSGVDLVTHLINDAFGYKVLECRYFDKEEVILKFFNFANGKVKKIVGMDKLKSSDNVLAFRLKINEGDEIQETTNDGNRHGFVIVRAKHNSRKLADEIIKQVKVTYYD